MKKIVFFDLDGTLLNEEKEIIIENKEAIAKARNNGIEVVICSGRPQSQVLYYQKIAGAGNYIITTNGAGIYDIETKQQLYSCGLDKDFCKLFYKYVLDNDLFFRIDTKYARYFNKEENRIFDEVLFKEEPEEFFNENLVEQFSISSVDSKQVDDVIKYLENFNDLKVENRYFFYTNNKNYDTINIINKNASKGNAIRGLCKYLKIDLKDSIGFGDDYNDISMFKAVGYSICMGNAKDEVKVFAKEVIDDNNNPGISKVLYQVIEENKKV